MTTLRRKGYQLLIVTNTLRPLLVVMVICQGPIPGCHGDRPLMLRLGHVHQREQQRSAAEEEHEHYNS